MFLIYIAIITLYLLRKANKYLKLKNVALRYITSTSVRIYSIVLGFTLLKTVTYL